MDVMYPMAVVGTAARGLIIYTLEGSPAEYKVGSYSLFTFSWPRFESGRLRNGGMLALRIFAGSMMSRKYCATSELLHVF